MLEFPSWVFFPFSTVNSGKGSNSKGLIDSCLTPDSAKTDIGASMKWEEIDDRRSCRPIAIGLGFCNSCPVILNTSMPLRIVKHVVSEMIPLSIELLRPTGLGFRALDSRIMSENWFQVWILAAMTLTRLTP